MATLLKVDQFAAVLGVTVACVRRWILERKITMVKIGRLIRIPAEEEARLIKQGLRPAVAVENKTKGETGQ